MNTFVVVGYYTLNTIYKMHAVKLIASLKKYKIPHYIEGVVNLGDWYLNTNYKPTFLKEMMLKFLGTDIVYVDCDAEFFSFPKLFEGLDCNIGVHLFNRTYYRHKKNQVGKIELEVLSGTIFLKNNKEVFDKLEEWEKECKRHPHVWDQRSLAKVLGDDFYRLPAEYCTIFDVMRRVKNPVIIHYQASREIRKKGGKVRKIRMRRKR